MIAAAEVEQDSILINKLRSSPKEVKLEGTTTTGFMQLLYYSNSACTSPVWTAKIYAVNVCLDFSLLTKYSSFYITADSTTGGSATVTYYYGKGCTNPDSTGGGAISTGCTSDDSILLVQQVHFQHRQ